MSDDTTPSLVDEADSVSQDDTAPADTRGWVTHDLTAFDQIGKTVELFTLRFLTRELMADEALIDVIRDAALEWVKETDTGRALYSAHNGHVSVEHLLVVDDADLRARLATRGVLATTNAQAWTGAALPLTGNLLKWHCKKDAVIR